MITFTKIKYQNFLAAGNAPIQVDLNVNPTTLVVGVNGTGKSTLSEAICFALFGRPLRNITKPKLVNSLNQRDCVVELDFRTNTNIYKIKRGIKPTMFEVYENGVLVPSPASAADYQTLLETTILKLNFKSFMQVVVLGSASYVPFMRLTPTIRREIIEDLLDIEVFSAMNALAKDDLAVLKIELDKVLQGKELLGEQVKMAQDFTEHLDEQRQQQLMTVNNQITVVTETIRVSYEDLARLKNTLLTYRQYEVAFRDATGKKDGYEQKRVLIVSKIQELRTEREFYEVNDRCPTCEQSLTDDLKQGRYNTLDSKEEGARKALAQCEVLIDKHQLMIDSAVHELDIANTLRQQEHGIQTALDVHEARLAELEDDRTRLSVPITAATNANIGDLQERLDELTKKHDELAHNRVIMDAAVMLLRDNGIKAKVIRHYIPIINRTLNAYLNAMDFPIQFMFDDEFSESIKSRYRDEFSYESFSEGEKKRIDLALLLTWRAVARIKNSAATNLLILDEVFDSSLDINGTEEFLKIIAGLEKDTRVFVISHKTDQLVDKFAHTITFVKNRGFSEIKL